MPRERPIGSRIMTAFSISGQESVALFYDESLNFRANVVLT